MSTRKPIAGRRAVLLALLAFAPTAPAQAQDQPDAQTRTAGIEQEKAEKATDLHPFVPGKAEQLLDEAQEILTNGGLHWHPFFESAYAGGGFTLGAGYQRYVSPYNVLDVRGSWTVAGYKRVEAQFTAPHLLDRHATLSVVGGWRDATQVGFFGIGTAGTSKSSRTNYSFSQPYAAATLDIVPTRRLLRLGGVFELSQWKQEAGEGAAPSIETVYTRATLPGLGATPTYAHSAASIGIDSRTAPGYSRRGGLYAITLHDYSDTNSEFGFRQVDYDAIQHFPILREAWVFSLRGQVQTTYDKGTQQIPFFMLPSLGGGSSLRGYTSWRFRDRNSLLLQGEWRAMVNRFIDMTVFCDAGKVTANRAGLDLKDLKSDYGFGIRFHGPLSTPLRMELAKGNEGMALVFSATAAF